ncbi:hypothetical protein BS17DRAFT_880663 [Gyrodon lividus]|nr:hypothetical protein BS17DRAFT_880663 [Gyrodon lividus]
MYFLRRLLAILRIYSLSFRRIIIQLAFRVLWFLRRASSVSNHTSQTLQNRDPEVEITHLPTSTCATMCSSTPMTSSSLSINRNRSPPVYFLAPSPYLSVELSHTSSIPQSAENTSTQLSQHLSGAPFCNLKPSLPEQMKRYKRTISIPKKLSKITLKPGKPSLNRPEVLGWNPEVHPEGALFYRGKVEGWVVLTDTDLTLQKNLSEINLSVESIIQAANQFSPSLNGPLVVLVVELANEDPKRTDTQESLYYFADHSEKLLFWVHEYSSDAIKKELCGGIKYATEDSHIKYALEAQYWMHCERFSNMVPMQPEYLADLRETLIHASTDTILSDTSVSPFAPDDLLKMLTVVAAIEIPIISPFDKCYRYYHSLALPQDPDEIYPARMMRLLTHSKFLNFHGQPGARLNADQSIYTKQLASEEGVISPLFYAFNFLLLTAPRKHMRTLRCIYVDQVINASRWKGFISGLKDEWNGYTVFSTVMLAVDISFLAVPGVLNGSYQTSQTPTAIAIYVSTIASLGTLVVSVLLADQIRRHGIESIDEGAAYMAHITHVVFGLEALSVMYSLPYALLIWSMLAFGVALSMMMFSSLHKVVLVVVASMFAIAVILASWPIICGRGRRATESRDYHTR